MPDAVIPAIESPQLATGIVRRIAGVLKFRDCQKKRPDDCLAFKLRLGESFLNRVTSKKSAVLVHRQVNSDPWIRASK
jgi:hypothetical protein